jgi:SAM-dependent methyltransferase
VADFESILSEAEALPVSGWDPSPIRGRWRTGVPPWDYRHLVQQRLASATTLLDLGTGGGEFLSSLVARPLSTYATEGYAPNLSVARQRLEPLGVRVIPIGSDGRIDLPSASIDLVTCRHEALDPDEVRRVLRPGGVLITQQVGARNYEEINERLGASPALPRNAVQSARGFATEISSAGLIVVDQREARYPEAFRDVGALVWYLRFAPWQVPGFTVARFRGELRTVDQEILKRGEFAVTAHRLLVVAHRP